MTVAILILVAGLVAVFVVPMIVPSYKAAARKALAKEVAAELRRIQVATGRNATVTITADTSQFNESLAEIEAALTRVRDAAAVLK